MKKLMLLALLLTVCCSSSFASGTEEGGGIVYGRDQAFLLQAPPGWVLDNTSGADQGVHAVFYPVGSSWRDSAVIAYAKGAGKDETIRDVPSMVDYTIKDFHANGSPDYSGEFVRRMKTEDGETSFDVYHFQGDQWGNYEAVAYFDEDKSISFIVLNSRDQATFAASLEAFYTLARSYRFMTETVVIEQKQADQ